MSLTMRKNISQDDIYNYLENLINTSPTGEIEVSASKLGEDFGIKGPSMEYHLTQLVKKGSLVLSENRGTYNRKIYKLPGKGVKASAYNGAIQEDLLKQLNYLKDRALGVIGSDDKPDSKGEQEESSTLDSNVSTNVQVDHSVEEENTIPSDNLKHIDNNEQTKELEFGKNQEKIEILNEMKDRQKTLDEKIYEFMEKNKAVPEPSQILTKDDREILAVMNETIMQNMLYLKDLEQQLSTVQTKAMVQHLIDERNSNLDRIAQLEDELKGVYRQLSDVNKASIEKQKNALEPQRIRMMQQIIAATVDQFVELPNHAMALGKGEFRKNINKEIMHLIQYVLGLED